MVRNWLKVEVGRFSKMEEKDTSLKFVNKIYRYIIDECGYAFKNN